MNAVYSRCRLFATCHPILLCVVDSFTCNGFLSMIFVFEAGVIGRLEVSAQTQLMTLLASQLQELGGANWW